MKAHFSVPCRVICSLSITSSCNSINPFQNHSKTEQYKTKTEFHHIYVQTSCDQVTIWRSFFLESWLLLIFFFFFFFVSSIFLLLLSYYCLSLYIFLLYMSSLSVSVYFLFIFLRRSVTFFKNPTPPITHNDFFNFFAGKKRKKEKNLIKDKLWKGTHFRHWKLSSFLPALFLFSTANIIPLIRFFFLTEIEFLQNSKKKMAIYIRKLFLWVIQESWRHGFCLTKFKMLERKMRKQKNHTFSWFNLNINYFSLHMKTFLNL